MSEWFKKASILTNKNTPGRWQLYLLLQKFPKDGRSQLWDHADLDAGFSLKKVHLNLKSKYI